VQTFQKSTVTSHNLYICTRERQKPHVSSVQAAMARATNPEVQQNRLQSQPTTPMHSTPATSQTLRSASPSGQGNGCESPAAGSRPAGASGRLLRTSLSALGAFSVSFFIASAFHCIRHAHRAHSLGIADSGHAGMKRALMHGT
jgi:hypothetical protein